MQLSEIKNIGKQSHNSQNTHTKRRVCKALSPKISNGNKMRYNAQNEKSF
jgi:hypothetical protein